MLLALLPLGGWAQGQRITDYGQKLEALQSITAAEAFIDSLDSDAVPTYSLDSLQELTKRNCADCRVHIPPAWVKADIDNDGRVDLLINGNAGQCFAVLNRGAAKPQVVSFAERGNRRWCRTVARKTRRRRVVLAVDEVEYVVPGRREHGIRPRRWRYDLMFHYGQFIEYAARPRRLPQQLDFRYVSGGPPSESNRGYQLRLNVQTGQLTGRGWARRDSASQGVFAYQLTPGALDTVRQYLAHLHVSKLKRHYEAATSDASFIDVKLHYRFRPTVKIEDYDFMAPYGMQAIYQVIMRAQKREIERRRVQLKTPRH